MRKKDGMTDWRSTTGERRLCIGYKEEAMKLVYSTEIKKSSGVMFGNRTVIKEKSKE